MLVGVAAWPEGDILKAVTLPDVGGGRHAVDGILSRVEPVALPAGWPDQGSARPGQGGLR
jgi:hypothetical protein